MQTLIDQLQRTEEDELAEAAAEALAKIGVPALPALGALATAPDALVRTHVYAALGGIRDERAFAILTDALGRDPECGDAIAEALYDQGRTEAIPLLYSAYRGCQPWQRVDFEEAIRNLHLGRTEKSPREKNWRVRYRRNPESGGYDLSWLSVSILLRKHGDVDQRPGPPLQSLEEIIASDADSNPPETCERCGAPIEFPTGLPVCPETALETALAQVKYLGVVREDGLTDISDVYDAIDARLWEHYETETPSKARERESWQNAVDNLGVEGLICRWLVEQGVEDIAAGRALLLAKAVELASRFGDPKGLLLPAEMIQRRVLKVGRNEPCPCGSGQKYKRCCLGNAPRNK